MGSASASSRDLRPTRWGGSGRGGGGGVEKEQHGSLEG